MAGDDGCGSSGKNRRKSSKHGSDIDVQPFIQVLQMIDKKYPSNERGDCLVFLSGINEIMTVFDAIQLYAAESKKWIVLPLHSSLSIEQQDTVFNIPPDGVRSVCSSISFFIKQVWVLKNQNCWILFTLKN